MSIGGGVGGSTVLGLARVVVGTGAVAAAAQITEFMDVETVLA